MKFEYKTLQFTSRGFFSHRIDTESLDQKLNTRGLTGWEVAGLSSSSNWLGATTEVIVTLKRPAETRD